MKKIIMPVLIMLITNTAFSSQLGPVDTCDIYKKYTLGIAGFGSLRSVPIVQDGDSLFIDHIIYLVRTDAMILVDADNCEYRITHPEYPYCSEITETIIDTGEAVDQAIADSQDHVVLVLEMIGDEELWLLLPY